MWRVLTLCFLLVGMLRWVLLPFDDVGQVIPYLLAILCMLFDISDKLGDGWEMSIKLRDPETEDKT